MKLTKREAIEISIELWTDLAETGANNKWKWVGWKKYGTMASDCALCEYSFNKPHCGASAVCNRCPYNKRFGSCQAQEDSDEPTLCDEWCEAETKKDRKEYASKFLKQLKGLLK